MNQVLAADFRSVDIMHDFAPQSLSLADLEAFDQRGGTGPEHGRRWRCPLPACSGKTERTLSADSSSGAWNCKRCGATGKLVEHRATTPAQRADYRTNARARALSSVFSLVTTPRPSAPADDTWRGELARCQRLRDTSSVKYLQGRGIPPELAHACGVYHASAWAPRREGTAAYSAGAAVVFPLRDRGRDLVALQGRYLAANATPKTRTTGTASRGVFEATVARQSAMRPRWRAFEAPAVILCEGPFDALSLAACGYPALAMCGCNLPSWIDAACAFKRVLIASDADERGEEAAHAWSRAVRPFAAQVERIIPPRGKDWNEALQVLGQDDLADWLAWHVLLTEPERERHLQD